MLEFKEIEDENRDMIEYHASTEWVDVWVWYSPGRAGWVVTFCPKDNSYPSIYDPLVFTGAAYAQKHADEMLHA